MDFFASDRTVIPAQGDLLISEPYLPDPNFERAVVLICAHDENGTVGFVLNKLGEMNVADVMEGVVGQETPLFMGGPVQQDTLHFVHGLEALKASSNLIGEGLYWGGDFEGLQRLLNTQQADHDMVRFFLGYSGWSPGQLEKELEEKSWIVCKSVTGHLIFNTKAQNLWRVVLNRMGGKFKLISNYPTDPRMN